jgi:hypothetical protein
MNRSLFIAGAICAAMIGSMLIPIHSSSAVAEQPPPEGCVAVSKIEFDSAKRKNMLHSSFAAYERAGGLFKRSYWYCL